MALLATNWNPGRVQLRQFGCLCAILLPLLGWWWSVSLQWLAGLAIFGGGIAVTAFVAPQIATKIYQLFMLIAFPIGLVVGELALLLIYFGIFWPIALVFRVQGRDRLMRKRPIAKSLWRKRQSNPSVSRYYHQS